MKKLIQFVFLFLLSISLSSQTINEDVIIGTWLTASGKAKVQIYKQGEKYFGKIVWLKNPNYEDGKPKVDKNNPNKGLQTTPLMGLNLLKGFKFTGEEWEDGTIYDPENGKTYSCFIKYRKDLLDLRGYIGFSLIGRTQTWFRIPEKK